MDDVIINKSAIIERCIKRIKDVYNGHEAELQTNYDIQDIVSINILRACEAALDIGFHLVRLKKLGVPQSSKEVFELLADADIIDRDLATNLKHMVGFRNIATHEYQKVEVKVIAAIIKNHLADLNKFCQILLL